MQRWQQLLLGFHLQQEQMPRNSVENILREISMRYLLILALILAGPAQATRITINAPIDGHIYGDVPKENSIHAGTISEAQKFIDYLRTRAESEAIYDAENVKNEEFELLENDIFGAEKKADRNSITSEFYSAGAQLVGIRSDMLELQLFEEVAKYRNAHDRYSIAKRMHDVEKGIEKKIKDDKLVEKEKTAEGARIAEFKSRNSLYINGKGEHNPCRNNFAHKWKNCIGKGEAEGAATAMEKAHKTNSEIEQARYNARLQELEKLNAISLGNLESAKSSLMSVLAAIKLGKVVCPQRCRIEKVFVVPGQYVNKGDPLFEFTWLKDLPSDD